MSSPGVSAETVAELERLHMAVGNSIALHKYLGAYLPTKRGKGLDWTLGEEAVALGRKTGYDYALFMHAEDSFASTGRVALQVLGIAGCFVGFCAPNIGGGGQFAYASLVDLQHRRSRVVQRRPGRQPDRRDQDGRHPHAARARRSWSTGCSTG